MLEGYSSNAIVAKIRSVYGKMLTSDDLKEMVSKRSVAEVADLLRSTERYSAKLRDVDPNTIHRALLERLLAEHCFETYQRFCEFQGYENKPFYDFLVRKNECAQMISLVNAVNCGLTESFVQQVPGYVLSSSKIDFLALASCSSIEELTAALKGTVYYKVFRNFRYGEDGRFDFPDAEIKLRTRFYNGLAEDIKKSFGSDSAELLRLIGIETDVINIINSYRLKAFFGYEPERIKHSMLPYSHMGKKSLRKLYESSEPQDMMRQIEKSVYGKYVSTGDRNVEDGLRRRALEIMKHSLAKTTSAPVALYAFMYICENEIRNIVRIIEGVRYDVDPALIFGMLII